MWSTAWIQQVCRPVAWRPWRASRTREILRTAGERTSAGSEIRTDGLLAYRELPEHGYRRTFNVIAGSDVQAHVSLPAVHRIAALLKRWLLGTHQGSVSAKHLDYYLDEFTFRCNSRASGARGLLFYRLL